MSRVRLKPLRQLLLAAGLGYLVYHLAPLTWARYRTAPDAVSAALRTMRETSFEQRRLGLYGDCGGTGYGYVSRMLARLPLGDALPAFKFARWDEGVELLLPEVRTRRDERVLLGVDVDESIFREQHIAGSRPISHSVEGARARDEWRHQTTWNFEELSRIELWFLPPAFPTDASIDLRLVESPMSNRELGRWQIPVAAGHQGVVSLTLPKPIVPFSLGRGTTDFLIFIEQPASDPPLANVQFFGAKATGGSQYRVVQRERSCFTALHKDLLDEAQKNPDGSWGRFVKAWGNVPR